MKHEDIGVLRAKLTQDFRAYYQQVFHSCGEHVRDVLTFCQELVPLRFYVQLDNDCHFDGSSRSLGIGFSPLSTPRSFRHERDYRVFRVRLEVPLSTL